MEDNQPFKQNSSNSQEQHQQNQAKEPSIKLIGHPKIQQTRSRTNSLQKMSAWDDIDEYLQNDQSTTINSSENQINEPEQVNLFFDLKTVSLQQIPQNAIYYEGFIQRKQSGLFSSWTKRFMALTNAKLYFFQNQKKVCLLSCVNLKHLQTKIQLFQDSFILNFQKEAEPIQLKATNKIEFQKWTQKLSEVITFRSKQVKVAIKKFNKNLYEQKDFLLQTQFLEKAQTGDILLVSTQNSAASLQKFITHSQFNHVALIVKYKGQTKIFQSNQDEGVNIYDWKQYLNMFKQHKRFAWRKLNYLKKESIDQCVKSIVKKKRGKSYSLNSIKLFRRVSSQNLEDQQSRGYFCSQLVAKCYKKLGLLDSQVSSVRYWPINFTSRGDMELKNNAFLSSQKNILLQKHLKL